MFFFEAQPLAAHEVPDRIVGHLDAPLRQHVFQTMQRQVRRAVDLLQDKITVGFKDNPAVATHLARRHAASLAISLAPLDHRRNSHRETGSHNTCRLAGNNSCYCTLPKIIRIGFYHACRPPVPARSLNHNSTKNGIPRFKQMMNRSSGPGGGVRALPWLSLARRAGHGSEPGADGRSL